MPLARRSSGSSVSRAPEASTSSRKAAQAGFRRASSSWNASRGNSLWQVTQTVLRR
ncbi:hypothetical protein BN1723_005152 [Verticillium longisporum]|uniref:Uncharacterized protein n=1 Tax=Verticillium longisporum TaxID=100787 RepID=A0A0G4N4F1_VERLO|nr:hypothetical protein BN1723_005152 [Verticillium longisporum]